jgi:hypothetical protein
MSQPYSSIPEVMPLNDTSPERKRSLSLSSIGSGSDISYDDPLDVEPFDEKRVGSDSRFQDEPRLEDGDEGARFLGSRRVRPYITQSGMSGADGLAETSKTVQEDFGGLGRDIGLCCWDRGFICSDICWPIILCGPGK